MLIVGYAYSRLTYLIAIGGYAYSRLAYLIAIGGYAYSRLAYLIAIGGYAYSRLAYLIANRWPCLLQTNLANINGITLLEEMNGRFLYPV